MLIADHFPALILFDDSGSIRLGLPGHTGLIREKKKSGKIQRRQEPSINNFVVLNRELSN